MRLEEALTLGVIRLRQQVAVSGGAVQWPPDGSGFRFAPMKPIFAQRSSSFTLPATGAPGDCGSMHTPTKFFG